MSSRPSGVNGRKRNKKTLNACQRCRTRKIKCSGQQPCHYCDSKKLPCTFIQRPKTVTISEEYLHELQRNNYDAGAQFSSRIGSSPIEASNHAGEPARQDPSVLLETSQGSQVTRHPSVTRLHDSNAFVQNGPIPTPRTISRQARHVNHDQTDLQNAIGDDYRRLGHSSSWAFSRHIRSVIRDATDGPDLHDAIPIKDGAYGIPWREKSVDFTGLELPKLDYAEYLVNTVYFAFSPLYFLFDKSQFILKLRDFYNDTHMTGNGISNLWLVQMLCILGFGHTILAQGPGPSGPTGAHYLARAVESLPDIHRLCQDESLAVEVMIIMSLFMQAMDMRIAAHHYIGMGARIAISNGFNRIFDRKRLSQEEFERRSKLWWTVYVIHRRLSSLIGVAPDISDVDSELEMPSLDVVSEDDAAMSFHVEISSQLGQILNVVYGLGYRRQLGGMFIQEIQAILKRQAEISMKLSSSLKIKLNDPSTSISRTAATLLLLLHQCSILSIRPILYFLLRKKIATMSEPVELSDAVVALLNICTQSAVQILKIAEILQLYKFFDYILPHDFDIVFSAAFVLSVIEIVTPTIVVQWDLKKILAHLDECKSRGIGIAGPYKEDLVELQKFRHMLSNRQVTTSQPWQLDPMAQIPGPGVTAHGSLPVPPLEQDLERMMATPNAEFGYLDPNIIFAAVGDLDLDLYDNNFNPAFSNLEWMF